MRYPAVLRFRWLAAMALLISLLGLAAPPASAATYQVTCSTSGFGCATGGYGPQNLGWPDNYYGQNWQAGLVHNCTRYAAFKLQQTGLGDPGSSFGNAYQWDDRVRAKFGADKVNGIPSVGAIAQWDSFPGDGGSGHVAYVEEVAADYIRVTDDAYGGGTTSKIIPVGHARWPSNFIHLTAPPPSPDRDGDGVPNTSDRCPDQPGPANTGGCPDTDTDGTADLDDQCPHMPGLPALKGCSEEDVNPRYGPSVDFDADGRSDYCRRVGAAYPQSRVSCTLSTGTGFGQTIQSPVLDWGYDTGRTWVGRSATVPGRSNPPKPRPQDPTPEDRSAQRIRVSARATKQHRLAIAVHPKQLTIRLQVHRKSRSGSWVVAERLRVRPPNCSAVIDLKAGSYRVFAPSQKGLAGDKSRTVRIKR